MPKLRVGKKGGLDVTAQLKKMKGRFDEGKQQSKTMFDKIDAGDYIGKLIACELTSSKTSGKLMIKRCHAPSEGDMKGKNVYDNMNIETDMGWSFCCQWLDTIGVEIEKPEELVEVCKSLNKEGYDCKFTVKHSKDSDFINVRVLELLEGDEGGEGEGEVEGDSEGDEVDLKKMDRTELEELIESYKLDITITKKMSDDDIRKAIKEAAGEGEGDSEGEEGGEEGDEDDETLQTAMAFCESNDIEIEADTDLEAIAEAIKGFEFKEADLEDDEKELLNTLEIYDEVVVKPVSKTKAKAKAKPKFKK